MGDSSTSYDTITGMDNVNNNPDTGTNNNNNNGSNDNGSDGNSNNGNSDNGGSTDAVKEGVDKIKDAVKDAQDNAEKSGMGKTAKKSFLGTNWLFLIIGGAVAYKVFF